MKIKHLVQKTYETTDSYAGINSVEERLLVNSFLVVMDDGAFAGILTSSDVIESPHQLVIDCLHHRPRVDFEQDMESVLQSMKESQSFVLPIFKGDKFVGVITEKAIMDYLLEYRKELEEAIFKRTAELKTANEQLEKEIKERRKALMELRESEERFRDTADMLPSVICEADIDMVVRYINNVGLETFGYSRSDFDGGINLLDLFHPSEKERAANYLKKTLKGAKVSPTEYRMLRKDGSEIFALVNSAPICKKREVVGIRNSLSDVTEKRKMEEELLKARKLESMATFAGGVANDINNLLAVTVGSIKLARMGMDPKNSASELLTIAEEAAWREKKLTDRLITFSADWEPAKEPTRIGDLIRDSVSPVPGSGVRCEVSIAEDLCVVDVDRELMRNVIKDLVSNADQSMPKGGVIKVRAENVTLATEDIKPDLPSKRGRYVKISIRDQGRGISEEDLSRIFDPYFSTKERGNRVGMGLGLSTAYSIIKKHGGHISVKSELGRGTTFFIYLPVSRREVSEEVIPEKSRNIARGKILVMDDEELVRDITRRMLEHVGYEVTLAMEGGEAIKLYEEAIRSEQPFDAVILDLTVAEGMGGRETVQRLLKIDNNVKAVVTSGYTSDPAINDFRRYGFSACIPKPYKMEELIGVLNGLIARNIDAT